MIHLNFTFVYIYACILSPSYISNILQEFSRNNPCFFLSENASFLVVAHYYRDKSGVRSIGRAANSYYRHRSTQPAAGIAEMVF